jgi:hypothetical protein
MMGRREGPRGPSLLRSYGAGHSRVNRAVVRKASRGVESTGGLPVGRRRNISGSSGCVCPEDDVVRAGSERPSHGASNRDVYLLRCEIIGVGSRRDRGASRGCRGRGRCCGRRGHGRPRPSTSLTTAASQHDHRCGHYDRTSDVHIPSDDCWWTSKSAVIRLSAYLRSVEIPKSGGEPPNACATVVLESVPAPSQTDPFLHKQ